MYLALLKPDNDDKIYVMAQDESGVLQGFEREEDGLRYFGDAYVRNHRRSFEASMSACAHFIQFNPRIAKVRGVSDIGRRLIDVKKAHIVEIGGVAGRLWTVEASRRGAMKAWETGSAPPLVDWAAGL